MTTNPWLRQEVVPNDPRATIYDPHWCRLVSDISDVFERFEADRITRQELFVELCSCVRRFALAVTPVPRAKGKRRK